MKVTLAEPRGFCSGVNRAINILDNVVKNAKGPVYVYHEIVHNAWVVSHFRRKGVVFVDSLDDVPDEAELLFSTHGVSPDIREQANKRKIKTIDATCPLVHSVHSQARNYAAAGYKIIFIGKRGHDEVVGTLGKKPGSTRWRDSKQRRDPLPHDIVELRWVHQALRPDGDHGVAHVLEGGLAIVVVVSHGRLPVDHVAVVFHHKLL